MERVDTGAAFRFRHVVDVRFRDVDAMGNAHHSLPLIYFEEARAAYWREVVGRATLADVDYTVGEAELRFHERILFPQRLTVGVRTTWLGSKSLTMEYVLWAEAGAVLTTGRTVLVMYDYATRRSKPIPEEVRRRIEAWEDAASPTTPG
ncbi:MAG TPA: thioesterase family protein [Longimicrobiales bacterium]